MDSTTSEGPESVWRIVNHHMYTTLHLADGPYVGNLPRCTAVHRQKYSQQPLGSPPNTQKGHP